MPLEDESGSFKADLWTARERAEREWRESLPCDEYPQRYTDGKKEWDGVWRTPKDSEYIDLHEISAHAGETYSSDTPGDCADLLEEIRASGLNVPQYAIDSLREESTAVKERST